MKLSNQISAVALLGLAAGTAQATPNTRYHGVVRGNVVTTGNTLGLAGGLAGLPSVLGRAEVFTDATMTLEAGASWFAGTTRDWRQNSSSAHLDLPLNARVVYAELTWGGSFTTELRAELDKAIVVRTPSGQEWEVLPDEPTSSPDNGSMASRGYYARSANVTSLIEGAGFYTAGRVPAAIAGADSAAGWGLHVVYELDGAAPRHISLTMVGEQAYNTSDIERVTHIPNLCLTPDVLDGTIGMVAIEGDAGIYGDTLRLADTLAGLDNQNARLRVGGAGANNIVSSRILNANGQIDTRGTHGDRNGTAMLGMSGGRTGTDIATIPATELMRATWREAYIRPSVAMASYDTYSLLSNAASFAHATPWFAEGLGVVSADRSIAALNYPVTVTLHLNNVGTAVSTGTELSLVIPEAFEFVEGSFQIDGVPVEGITSTELASGIALPDFAIGDAHVVTFEALAIAETEEAFFSPVVTYANGTCEGAAVVGPWAPEALNVGVTACGDGIIREGELCDDGNMDNFDGCSSSCQIEPGWACDETGCSSLCGDGIIAVGAEACDDGNNNAADGCSDSCQIEPGYSCVEVDGLASVCSPGCGDSVLADYEGCDDGNRVDGDGCSASCKPESGWGCDETGCGAICGDGLTRGAEACDDGNLVDGDGCSASCALEEGWNCGEAGCEAICGDGLLHGAEQCDDGNLVDGDGCSPTCEIQCDGQPCAVCGDGQVSFDETCDDGNTEAGDGCSALCQTESGFVCDENGCTTLCGDGEVAGAEVCDDGNAEAGDGCSAECQLEDGFECSGTPSVCEPVDGGTDTDTDTDSDTDSDIDSDESRVEGGGCAGGDFGGAGALFALAGLALLRRRRLV